MQAAGDHYAWDVMLLSEFAINESFVLSNFEGQCLAVGESEGGPIKHSEEGAVGRSKDQLAADHASEVVVDQEDMSAADSEGAVAGRSQDQPPAELVEGQHTTDKDRDEKPKPVWFELSGPHVGVPFSKNPQVVVNSLKDEPHLPAEGGDGDFNAQRWSF